MKKILSSIITVGLFLFFAGPVKADYRVGVDYHATGEDFLTSSFISIYNQPAVRALVREQLQGMADSGVKIISTRLWMYNNDSDRYENGSYYSYRLDFPYSSQDLANIRQYATDVSEIKTPDGGHMDLYFTLLWLMCANFNNKDLAGNYSSPKCGYNWSQYTDRAKQAIDGFFNAVGDLEYPDTTKVVKYAYLNGEVSIPFVDNTDIFLKEIWPYFTNAANAKGITPTMYFMVWPDSEGDLYRLQTTLNFLRDNNLPIPARIDVSMYINYLDPSNNNFSRVDTDFNQMVALYPGKSFAISETNYPADPARRLALGQAFVNTNKRLGEPVELTYWTTPQADEGLSGPSFKYPFDIASYYPTPLSYITTTPNRCSLAPSQTTCTSSIFWASNTGGTLCILVNNAALFACGGSSGTAQAPWITPSGYTFTLYSGYDQSKTVPQNISSGNLHELASVFVKGIKQGDLNEDDKVDIFDYNLLATNFGNPYTIIDYQNLLANFGK